MTKWIPLHPKKPPAEGYPYLIRTDLTGPIYDVAYFNGRHSDGTYWWTITNTAINEKDITHYAVIDEPEGIE